MMTAANIGEASGPGPQQRVLIIDDDRDFAEGLEDFLAIHGYSVEIADSPATAIAIADSFRPDVALVDIRLGRWDGLDVISELKSTDSDPICVMVTGYAELQTSVEALRRGALDYLKKPLYNNEVLSVLERCFETRRAESAKKLVEDQLRSSEERFRSTFDQAAVGMARIGPQGHFYRVNQQFSEILGYSPAELLEMTMADVSNDTDVAENAEGMAAVLAGETPTFQRENRFVRKDETVILANTTVSLVRNHRGDAKYYVVVLEDITERNRAQEQIVQSQRMEAIGQLTSGIAHDFNNLLMVVIGNLEFLREPNLVESSKDKFVDAAERAAWRGAELTQRLLAFSRRQSLRPQPTDLSRMVQETLEMLGRTLGEAIVIETNLTRPIWHVRADPAQVENAFVNLALNARDAMAGGGTLTIVTTGIHLEAGDIAEDEALEPGDYAMLSVSDTGEGMTDDIRKRAIEPFFTTRDVGEGSGLGLSMIHGFASQSGGGLRIESKLGEGTRVSILLPRMVETSREVIGDGSGSVDHPPAATGASRK